MKPSPVKVVQKGCSYPGRILWKPDYG